MDLVKLSMALFLLPMILEGMLSITSKSMCTEYWSKLAQEISEVRSTNHLDMTMAVDWDVKPQTKHRTML